jgi:hypothetical protein
MRGLFTSVRALCADLWLDAKDAADRHLNIFLDDVGSPRALYVKLPCSRLSVFLEWRDTNAGWSVERLPGSTHLWFGVFEVCFCTQPDRVVWPV